jgi:hypothetical protein
MKRTAYTIMAMVILVGSMAVAAEAQSASRTLVRANIPFEFNVGDKALPAGQYTIRQVNPSSDVVVLQLKNSTTGDNLLVRVNEMAMSAQAGSKLIFTRLGSHYFFSTVTIEGFVNAWQAPKSRAERGLERELAILNSRSERVAIAAR